MKYWPDEWKVPMTSKKGQKGKQPVETGTSHKSNSPTTNTRKVAEHTKDTGGSVIVRKPRQQKNIPNPSVRRRITEVTNGGDKRRRMFPHRRNKEEEISRI
jgi:hypothetical protein